MAGEKRVKNDDGSQSPTKKQKPCPEEDVSDSEALCGNCEDKACTGDCCGECYKVTCICDQAPCEKCHERECECDTCDTCNQTYCSMYTSCDCIECTACETDVAPDDARKCKWCRKKFCEECLVRYPDMRLSYCQACFVREWDIGTNISITWTRLPNGLFSMTTPAYRPY